uniref:Putative group iv salivary lipocalin lipocalin salivary gland overexpressed n=1 Tax=Rhipicephalus microplus TaxID=6941 RepID=A0A6M2D6M7_RHIMP
MLRHIACLSCQTLFLDAIEVDLFTSAPHQAASSIQGGAAEQFLQSSTIYLNSTTVEYPGVVCIKIITRNEQPVAKTLPKMEVKVLSDNRTLNKVDYKLVKRAQWVTSDNNRTNESTKYIFRLTFDDCAIVEKRKENTTQAYTEGWELWVNDRFHSKEKSNATCKTYYRSLCNCTEAKQYNNDDCDDKKFKATLLL